ncbi:MAG: elongation factor P maturation arginine rhamnosyltransferase EarP [Halothiobacillaceae bacterium]|nr:MAG: elongation factor P maturation arginine rhamnosyltransferase EarP [Halothiobacillaceae bacterium]
MNKSWDIFSAVVDNLGDIATCWRLARLLHHEHGQDVRLWVDDLATMRRLVPATDADAARQWIDGIDVRHWTADFPHVTPADVVIEAFGCPLPEGFLVAMRDTRPLWINLEYFSAEDWVAGCHTLPSPQDHGLRKYFFFPGIQPGSGGLLRERDLLEQRAAFLQSETIRRPWCDQWQVPIPEQDGLILSLFTYEHPALPVMLRALSRGDDPVTVYVPAGRTLNSLRELFPDGAPRVGDSFELGSLSLHVIPFLPQAEYDRLLWLCDINFVRGEESLARAIWSGKPFIWHVYPTADRAHLDKLDAFVAAYTQDSPALADAPFAELMRAWNDEGLPAVEGATDWSAALKNLKRHTSWFERRAGQLAQSDDLSAQLVKFAAGHYNAAVKQPLSTLGNP